VLVSVSIQDLRPNPQDTSSFYLANIYQLLAQLNASHLSTPSPFASPPAFSPPTYAIWVNSLWFLSLSISLVCALLATSQQQWIRSYIEITQTPQILPQHRARIHAFLSRIMYKDFFRVLGITGVLIHLSLFLFLLGLLIYLFNTNHTVFCAIVWFIMTSAMVYLIITLMPACRIGTPYRSPFSGPICRAFAAIIYGIVRTLNSFIRVQYATSKHFRQLEGICLKGLMNTLLTSALNPSLDIFSQILDRTIDIMDDRELEWALTRFCDLASSSMVGDTERLLAKIDKSKWSSALAHFSIKLLSSNSLFDWYRICLCMEVADLAHLPEAGWYILRQIFHGQHPALQSVEMGGILRERWSKNNKVGSCTRILASGIIANVRRHDDAWIALAADQLGKSEYVIQGYQDYSDDSVLLVNLIHVTRQIIQMDVHIEVERIFRSLSNLDIRNTLPGLQHDFLTLWNEIDHPEIRDNLRDLRNILNQGSDDHDVSTAPLQPVSDTNSPTDVATFLPIWIDPGPELESPPPAPISVPPPVTPSALDPSGTATSPLSTRHEVQDLNDPVETDSESIYISRQANPSA
jgi:Family of unknown function (DUF6535)